MLGPLVKFFLPWPRNFTGAHWQEGFFFTLRVLAGVIPFMLFLLALYFGNLLATHLFPPVDLKHIEQLEHRLTYATLTYLAVEIYAAVLAWRLAKLLIFWIDRYQKSYHARHPSLRFPP